jgi:hypothetical protein
MEYIKAEQAAVISRSSDCIVHEYEIEDRDINLASVTISV